MKAGDVVKVKVVEVDVARQRIALSMILNDEKRNVKQPEKSQLYSSKNAKTQREKQPSNSAMADAFAQLKR